MSYDNPEKYYGDQGINIEIKHDSMAETQKHKDRVRTFIYEITDILEQRGVVHDDSKFCAPEKEILDEWTPKLRGVTYGSDEYREMPAQMKPMVEHHHKHNRHHPEYYKNGVDGMDLIDVIEMFCDWKAATKRHDDGDIRKSIEINQKRHRLSGQLAQIFLNTVENLKW